MSHGAGPWASGEVRAYVTERLQFRSEGTSFVCDVQTAEFAARVELRLPTDDGWPVFYVDRSALPQPFPHVERDGRLCLVVRDRTIVDERRPTEVVDELWRRARKILFASADERSAEVVRELSAYWPCSASGGRECVVGLGDPSQGMPRLFLPQSGCLKGAFIVTQSERAPAWLQRATPVERGARAVLLLPRQTVASMAHISFEDALTIGRLEEWVASAGGDSAAKQLLGLQVPGVVLFPLCGDDGRPAPTLAVLVERAAPIGRKGQRTPALAPTVDRLRKIVKLTRVVSSRFDSEWTRARIGAPSPPTSAPVVVVGVGAVGSRIAILLAQCGFFELRLVDGDLLESDNLLRHEAGISQLRCPKVEAVATILSARFPSVQVSVHRGGVGRSNLSELVRDAGAVIDATGAPSVARTLDDGISDAPLLHAWVEGGNVGGFALYRPGERSGAGYTRLLPDTGAGERGLRGRLHRQPQQFDSSLAGCQATFTPHGALLSDRAANEAVDLLLRRMSVGEERVVLRVWRTLETTTEHALTPFAQKYTKPGGVTEFDLDDASSFKQILECERDDLCTS